MKVKELIDKLKEFNLDDDVYVQHCRPYEYCVISLSNEYDKIEYNEKDNCKGVKIIIYEEYEDD